MPIRSLLRTLVPVVAFGAAVCTASESRADTVPGTVLAVFGGVVTQGYDLNDPTVGKRSAVNNAGTAVYSISNSTDPTLSGLFQANGSVLSWGDNAGGTGMPSTLTFFGATSPATGDTPFTVGRLMFTNGASSGPSVIFAATIRFYNGSVTTANYLGQDTVVINTTINNGPTPASNADYLNICGTLSDICGQSIDAIEASDGGTGFKVELGGVIVGDPMLQLTSVVAEPGQNPATTGFVGTDPALAVPEPASLALLGTAALLGTGITRRRRTNG